MITEDEYAKVFYLMDSELRFKILCDINTQQKAINRAYQGAIIRANLTPFEALLFDMKVGEYSLKRTKNYEVLKNILDYVIFDNFDPNKAGVYFINDFYIGKSDNIKNRICSHLIECVDFYNGVGKIYNQRKQNAILESLRVNKLVVKRLSTDPKTEKEYIQKLCFEYDLVNMDYNTNLKPHSHYLKHKKLQQ
jgi:uncharacterized protein YktA (UPF0223 family)